MVKKKRHIEEEILNLVKDNGSKGKETLLILQFRRGVKKISKIPVNRQYVVAKVKFDGELKIETTGEKIEVTPECVRVDVVDWAEATVENLWKMMRRLDSALGDLFLS